MKSTVSVIALAMVFIAIALSQRYLDKDVSTRTWPVNVQEIPPSCLTDLDASSMQEFEAAYQQVLEHEELSQVPLMECPIVYPTEARWKELAELSRDNYRLFDLPEMSELIPEPDETRSDHRIESLHAETPESHR